MEQYQKIVLFFQTDDGGAEAVTVYHLPDYSALVVHISMDGLEHGWAISHRRSGGLIVQNIDNHKAAFQCLRLLRELTNWDLAYRGILDRQKGLNADLKKVLDGSGLVRARKKKHPAL